MFSLPEIVNFIQQMCTGLAHCHKHLSPERKHYAFGDLKPDNILIDKHHILKLADFSGGNTPGWSTVELDVRIDIYCLGKIFLAMLRTIPDSSDDFRNAIDDLLRDCLHLKIEHAKQCIIFSTPFLLNVLFQEEYPILRRSLDKVSIGLGEKSCTKVREYIEMEAHRPYREAHLGDQEIIFWAELLAVQDHHHNPHCSASTTEGMICHTLPLCRKSRTATEMWIEITSWDEWDQIVLRSREEICFTTDPGLNLHV